MLGRLFGEILGEMFVCVCVFWCVREEIAEVGKVEMVPTTGKRQYYNY